MRRSVPLMLVAILALSPAGTGHAQTTTPELTPERWRITDPAIARDREAMDALGRRLAAFDTVAAPGRVYTRALGNAWLTLARDQYAMNDRSGLVDVAFERAATITAALEARQMILSPQSGEIAGSPTVRPELWKLADSLKRTEALRCVAEEVASLELTLVRAGHEATICRPADPHPHALAATDQGTHVRTLADKCVLEVPVAVAQVEAPLPETTPAPVPEAVRAALVRLSAMGNVHFDLNAETISDASATVLDSVVAVMGSVREVRATLIGHTDPRGSVAYNLALGHRRASAVRDYLTQRGVDPARLTIGSQGKATLVAVGVDARDYALNRRVEIQYSGPIDAQLSVRRQEGDLQIERPRPKVPARVPAKGPRRIGSKPVVKRLR
jgi:outer membrane protein OmpA-like peptidoglycan-associated protein